MVALAFHEEVMEKAKIVVVMREEYGLFADRKSQVNGIGSPGNAQIGGHQDIMSCLAQQLDKHHKNAVIVELELHRKKILA
jgi:hypothetical protein